MYIGVTGFTERAQVRQALARVPSDASRLFMVGVLASRATLAGEPAGNPQRYPRREDIAGIFDLDWRALNLVHYHTGDQMHLESQLWHALRWGGPACDGLQLNIVWPSVKVVRGLRHSWPGMRIVFQLNRGAMMECRNDAEKVADRVSREYGDIVDYVLVDASAGKGEPLVPVDAASYLLELERFREHRQQSYALLVAGGLHATNLRDLLTPVRMLVSEFGIDAEGALRTDDRLDDEKVGAYIDAAYGFLNGAS